MMLSSILAITFFLPLNIHFAAKFGFLILCICLPDFGGVGLVGATF